MVTFSKTTSYDCTLFGISLNYELNTATVDRCLLKHRYVIQSYRGTMETDMMLSPKWFSSSQTVQHI